MKQESRLRTFCYLSFSALIMGYGWGYRGTVGHEAGAMIPGALVGMALTLASGRRDWQRRTAVTGFFSAVGFAWGGSLSYMEQTFYVLSDSFPDVFYGYSVLFFLGALWAGIGGAVLGMALTESRSELGTSVRPFLVICTVFFVVYLYFFFHPDHKEAYETLTVRRFHDGDWLSALLILLVSCGYWFAVPRDRKGTALFLLGALGWWIGYLGLTKFGGLRLAPLHRSESWGGVLGVLVVLFAYLYRRKNRAALMMGIYGLLGGGFGFAFAVFIRHPLLVEWGPFASRPPLPLWTFSEVLFGCFMGGALGLGALRLLRTGLAPPAEDTPAVPLDVVSVFSVLVAVNWINFRRHVVRFGHGDPDYLSTPILGFPLWGWYVLAGVLMTWPVLYGLVGYYRGNRSILPESPAGKGALLILLLMGVTVAAKGLRISSDPRGLLGNFLLWIPAVLSIVLVQRFAKEGSTSEQSRVKATFGPSSLRWKKGNLVRFSPLIVLAFLLTVTCLSMATQEGPMPNARRRFGPDAYWRQTARLLGEWKAAGFSAHFPTAHLKSGDDLPLESITFHSNRRVTVRTTQPELSSDRHRWFLKNQYIWLRWETSAGTAETPLRFNEGRLYIAWPPGRENRGYLVFDPERNQYPK